MELKNIFKLKVIYLLRYGSKKKRIVVISGQLRNGRISRLLNVLWGKIMKKLNAIRKTMAFYWNLKKWLFTAE
jgi:hypothetical protein